MNNYFYAALIFIFSSCGAVFAQHHDHNPMITEIECSNCLDVKF